MGDPCVFGNLKTDPKVEEAIEKALRSKEGNGYSVNIAGYTKGLNAIAKKYGTIDAPIDPNKDVFFTNGVSHALELVMQALGGQGKNILTPRPGFSLYKCLAENAGMQHRYYDLSAAKGWEVDFDQAKSQIDENTVAILVNNPSNPCGSNYSKSHLIEILEFARISCIPVISDEIYADMTWAWTEDEDPNSYPLATLSAQDSRDKGLKEVVPVITVNGLAKKYLVPGWRCGWITIFDPMDYLSEIRMGIVNLLNKIMACSGILQCALDDIFTNTPESFFQSTNQLLESHARLIVDEIKSIAGLHVIIPRGALYVMITIDLERFPEYKTDIEFTAALVKEESVFVLPGTCFGLGSSMRIVTSAPSDMLKQAMDRMKAFIERHIV